MAWTWRLYLFSEVFPTPFLEKGRDVEVGASEISCLAFEVWLGAQWKSVPCQYGKNCPPCSHECGSCSASCPWLLCTLEAAETTCLYEANHTEAGMISKGSAVPVTK